MKRLTIAAIACLTLFTCKADVLFVSVDDPLASDVAGEGRGSEALPYKTIQAAVEAASENSTIKVKPGVYDQGAYVTTEAGGPQSNRVYIAKTLRVVSTHGAAKTEIRGAFGTNGSKPEYLLGTDSVRPVYIAAAGRGSRIEGFTIQNGATRWSSDGGGAVYAADGGTLVDCTVTNCMSSGKAGGVYGVTAVRCLIGWTGGRSWECSDATSSKLWNCVIVNTRSGSGEYAVRSCVLVNCTVFGREAKSQLKYNDSVLYNTLSCPFNYTTYNYAEGFGGTVASTNTLYRKDYGEVKQCCNPMFGDYRLLDTSVAIGAGDAKWIVGDEAPIVLPDGVEVKDFHGNDLSQATGAVNCGASQSVVTPRYGGVQCSTYRMTLNGVLMNVGSYAFAESWPVRWEVVPDGSEQTLWVNRNYENHQKPALYSDVDGRFTFVPPPAAGKIMTMSPVYAGVVLHVDDENGSLSGTGTQEDAYKTVQQALDYAASAGKNALVRVAPGTYDEGGVEVDGLLNRVKYTGSNQVLVKADEGPEKTFIVGSPDGAENVRCAYLNAYVCLQGFTLAGGRSCGDTDASRRGAAAVAGYLRDCVVSNCTATTDLWYHNSGAGNAMRTRFIGNTFQRVCSISSPWAFDVFYGNTVTGVLFDNSFQGCKGFNLTVVGNVFTGTPDLIGMWRGSLDNCILDLGGYTINARDSYGPNIVWNGTMRDGSSDNFHWTDPRLYGADEADFRPDALSPAIGLAEPVTETGTLADGFLYLDADVYGRPFGFSSDGKMAVGAAQSFVPCLEITAAGGGLSVSGAGIGYEAVADGDEKTVSVSKAEGGLREIVGVIVSTRIPDAVETNLFADLPGGVWTHTVSGSASSVRVEACYVPDVYVDALNGDDANDGLTAATPKKTLANGLPLVNGDVVHVAPGTYDAGSQSHSRVVVPEGVTYRASGSREETLICGEAGMRGVYMDKNSRLEGFTVLDGRDSEGSGVYALDNTARIVDCAISAASGASVVHNGMLVRCRITMSAYVTNNCVNSTLVSCYAKNSYGGTVVCAGKCDIRNSTLVPAGGYVTVNGTPAVYNSVVFGYATKNGTYNRCIFATNAVYTAWNNSTFLDPSSCTDCAFVTVDEVKLDAGFRPTSESSLVIDQGDNSFCITDADTRFDLPGVPRISDYTVDIGAFEYHDFRAAMKDVFGRKVSSVDWYSAAALVNAAGRVLLDGDGATVVATGRETSGFSVDVEMAGEGVLTLSVNGTAVSTLSSSGAFRLSDMAEGDALTFRFEGEGSASLGRLRGLAGSVIIVL